MRRLVCDCRKEQSSAVSQTVKAEGKKEVITQDEVMAQVSCLYRARQHKLQYRDL